MRLSSLVDYAKYYEKEFALYEGLILTHPITSAIPILQQKFPKFYYRAGNNDFIIKTSTITEEQLSELLVLLNNIGWFIAYMNITYISSGNASMKFDHDFLLNKIHEQDVKGIVFDIEAKYDLEIPRDKWPKILYHATTEKNFNRIGEIGLIPTKSKEEQSSHPDRIYLSFHKDDLVNVLLPLLKKHHPTDTKWVLLDIDPFWVNGPFRLFRDPDYNGGFYTLTNIPRTAIIKSELI
jgi:hypothetical protein